MPTGDLLFAHFPPLLFFAEEGAILAMVSRSFCSLGTSSSSSSIDNGKGENQNPSAARYFSPNCAELGIAFEKSPFDPRNPWCKRLRESHADRWRGIHETFCQWTWHLSNFSRLSRALLLSFSGCLVSSDKAFHPYSWQRNLGMERCSFPPFLLLIHHISLSPNLFAASLKRCLIAQSSKAPSKYTQSIQILLDDANM